MFNQALSNNEMACIIESKIDEGLRNLDSSGRACIKITDSFTVRCSGSEKSIREVARKFRKAKNLSSVRKIKPPTNAVNKRAVFDDMWLSGESKNAINYANATGLEIVFNCPSEKFVAQPILRMTPVKGYEGFVAGRIFKNIDSMSRWFVYHVDTGMTCGGGGVGYKTKAEAVKALTSNTPDRLEKALEQHKKSGGNQERVRREKSYLPEHRR